MLAFRRDYRILEQYKYLFGITAIGLMMLAGVPASARRSTARALGEGWAQFQFQPGELAKIFLIVFLAGYLRDKAGGAGQGRLKDFGPLLLIWGAGCSCLVQTTTLAAPCPVRDFLAMLYVATGRAPTRWPGWRSSSPAPPSSTATSGTCRNA